MALGGIIKSFPAPGANPRGLSFDGRYIWTTDANLELVYQLDLRSGAVIKSFNAPSTNTNGLAFDGYHFWLTDFDSDLIYQLSIDNGAVIKSLTSPAGVPLGITVYGYHLFLTSLSATVYVIDLTNGAVVRTLSVSGFSRIRGIAHTGHSFWITDDDIDNRIVEISPKGAVIRSFLSPVPPPGNPSGIAFDGQSLWHCDFNSDTIYQLSLN